LARVLQARRSELHASRCVLQCVAVCCSVLQCVAICCNMLQCVAVCCSMLQCVAVCCSVLQCVTLASVLQARRSELHASRCVLQFVAACCSMLQCVTLASVLQARRSVLQARRLQSSQHSQHPLRVRQNINKHQKRSTQHQHMSKETCIHQKRPTKETH